MKTYVIDIADPAESLPSSVAAAQAILEAGDEVHLFHHVFHPRLAHDETQSDDELVTEARQNIIAARRAQLVELARALNAQSVTCEVAWTDSGWQALIQYVKDSRADMLIAQSNRPSRWRRLARTNEDWQLIRHSPVPLLLTRPECSHKYERILAAVDPLHADDKPAQLDHSILNHAASISKRHGASLCVLNIATPSVTASVAAAPAPDLACSSPHVIEAHRAEIARLTESLDCEVSEVCVIPGVPANEIVQHAKDSDTNLVVMGAVSRSALRNLLIGNTAEKVLDQLSADTLIIKPAASDGAAHH